MDGNSFPTKDGGHVTGAVNMAVDKNGCAVPVKADTPIGTVTVQGGITLEQFCRALAAHVVAVNGGGDAEKTAQEILGFAKPKESADA